MTQFFQDLNVYLHEFLSTFATALPFIILLAVCIGFVCAIVESII